MENWLNRISIQMAQASSGAKFDGHTRRRFLRRIAKGGVAASAAVLLGSARDVEARECGRVRCIREVQGYNSPSCAYGIRRCYDASTGALCRTSSFSDCQGLPTP
jgi:hypothetical protein